MKILAFGASSSKNSINKALATYAASMVENADVEVLDLNDFDLPMYSEDTEKENGQPKNAKDFLAKIASADCLVISFAEHNGSYTAAYKNLFDWASRSEPQVYQDKPTIFLATSPGPGGASSVLASAEASAQYFGVDLKASLSVANFYDVFDKKVNEISDPNVAEKLRKTMQSLT
jgi:NAD(P)H-dependent FMN reductase